MNLDDYAFLSSEIRELESILADIPAERVIDRMSFQGRLKRAKEANATARLFAAAPAMLAALEAQVEADRLSGIYQTYADAPAHASDPDYDSRCDEMHAAWMQAQDLAEKLRDAALSAARGDGKGEAP